MQYCVVRGLEEGVARLMINGAKGVYEIASKLLEAKAAD